MRVHRHAGGYAGVRGVHHAAGVGGFVSTTGNHLAMVGRHQLDERRLAMSRRHNNGRSYIEWLKSLSCVFYAPLKEDDFTEYISGEPLTVTGNGSMVWDSSRQMYHFTSPTVMNSGVLEKAAGFSVADNSLTLIGTVARQTSGDGNMCAGLLTCAGGVKFGALLNCKNSSNSPTSVMSRWVGGDNTKKIATVLNHNGRAFIQDGVQYFADGYVFGINHIIDTVHLAASIDSSISGSYARYNGANFFLSEVYIFNTALNLATIRKIQGID